MGIIAPAGALDAAALETGCRQLRALGYHPFYLDSICDRDVYFAGPLERRVREFTEMWEREDVRAIICARGGYGCNYLLPHLDIARITANPKIFVGYSDVTTLLTWFADHGLAVFHGPMVAKDFAHEGGVEVQSLRAALGGEALNLVFGGEAGVTCLREGEAAGRFYGGCLSMLVAALGTRYDIATRDAVLFIEDIGVHPYQVDRMLMQLKYAGKLDEVRALVFGEFADCAQSGEQDYPLQKVIMRVVGDMGIPVMFGLRSGHVSAANLTLPIGTQVAVAASARELRLEFERATAPRNAKSYSTDGD